MKRTKEEEDIYIHEICTEIELSDMKIAMVLNSLYWSDN